MASFADEEKAAAAFLRDQFPRPDDVPADFFARSVRLMEEGIELNAYNHFNKDKDTTGATCPPCLHPRVEGWKLSQCADCKADLGQERLDYEEAYAGQAAAEDTRKSALRPHAERIHALAMPVNFLLAFTHDHDCWDWPTWRVVRDIIVPATSETRCRYGELPGVIDCVGPANVFASHCWGSDFGDLVGAVCHGARSDRRVWIDIFAVRQWPGNVADLDFRGVIQRCHAFIVSVSPLPFALSFFGQFKTRESLREKFFESKNGQLATQRLPFFRLWCVVEIACAVSRGVPVLVKCGFVERDEKCARYVTWGGHKMMESLEYMIDVESAFFAVEADYDREIAVVRSLDGGAAKVNDAISGVLVGSVLSTLHNILEVDAYVCGEKEPLRAMKCLRFMSEGEDEVKAGHVLVSAAAGGRKDLLEELLKVWSVSSVAVDKDLTREEREKLQKRAAKWLPRLILEHDAVAYAACGGHLEIVKLLLSIPGLADIKKSPFTFTGGLSEHHGVSALHHCCERGNINMVRFLLTRDDVDVNDVYEEYSDGGSESNGDSDRKEDIDGKMSDEDEDEEQDDEEEEETGEGDHKVEEELDDSEFMDGDAKTQTFSKRVPLSGPSADFVFIGDDVVGGFSLHSAVAHCRTDILALLLQHPKIDVNICTLDCAFSRFHWSPLHAAAHFGHVEVVKLLLSHSDIDIDAKDDFGRVPLVFARRQNHTEIVQMLTLAGAVVPPISLRDALLMDDVEIFAEIWREEMEVQAQEVLTLSDDDSPKDRECSDLNCAREDECRKTAPNDKIGDRVPFPPYATEDTPLNRKKWNDFCAVAAPSDSRSVQRSWDALVSTSFNVKEGLHVYFSDDRERHGSGTGDEESSVSDDNNLSSSLSSVSESYENEFMVPLHLACERGRLNIVKYLLENSDPNVRDDDGKTALHACLDAETVDESGRSGTADDAFVLLVRHPDTDLNASCSLGTAAEMARKKGREDLVQILSEAGADVPPWDLFMAVEANNLGMAQALLAGTDNVNSKRASDGATVLHVACSNGHTALIRLILERDDVDVMVQNNEGEIPLEVAWKEKDTELLLEAGSLVPEDFEEEDFLSDAERRSMLQGV